jgi:hypothetical protein
MEMSSGKRGAQPLFQCVTPDGVRWVFVVLPGDRWTILRNGQHLEMGTVQAASLRAGVDKFLRWTGSNVGAGQRKVGKEVAATSA